MFKFKASYLPLLAAHMATKDVRYYLNGVYIEPLQGNNGVVLVATDGHRMAVIHDPTGEADKPQIFKVSTQLVSAAKKRRTKLGMMDRRVSYQDGGRITCTYETGEEVYIQPGFLPIIEGKYPDWRRVFPKRTRRGAGTAIVNGGYVSVASDHLAALAQLEVGRGFPAVEFWHNDDNHPCNQTLIIGSAAMQNARVLIMPMRNSKGYPGRPGWMECNAKPTDA